MRHAIKTLKRFYNKDCGKSKSELGPKYIEKYHREKNQCNQKNTLHYMRRIVSKCFQALASHFEGNLLTKKTERAIQTRFDLSIVKKIICPLELEAVSQCDLFTEEQDENKPEKVKLMMEMYYELNPDEKPNPLIKN